MTLRRFFARRARAIALTLFCVATFTFLLTFAIPSDPARLVVGPKGTPDDLAMARRMLGLNDPLIVQFARYLWDVAHLDFGYSYGYRQPVADIIAQRLPWTALLAAGAIAIQSIVGITAGLLAAASEGRLVARGLLGLSLIAISLPPFWIALILLYLFAYVLPVFPMGGAGFPGPLVLPALALALPGSAWYLRFMHAASVETLHADFVLAARSKGTPPRFILFKHVLKASLSPLLTMIAIDFGYFLGGAVIIETVFGWPGIGLAAFQAMRGGDIPLLMGCVLTGSFFVLLMNLLADTARTLIDPRVRLS